MDSCSGKVIYRIPVFRKVSDKERIKSLNDRLAQNLKTNQLLINLSELDIIGVTEVFNNNDSLFEIKYSRKSEIISQLTTESIIRFIESCGLTMYEGLEKVKVTSYNNSVPVRTDVLYNLIDYTDDESRCVLSKGKWYYFNEDYLDYLAASMAEIDVLYDSKYDYCSELYEEFIAKKYEKERNDSVYKNLSDVEVMEKLRKRYYRERAYNLYISERYNFECRDRQDTKFSGGDGEKIELMDLYKDKIVFAVKAGSASSVLCYVVDQSLSTLKMYKDGTADDLPEAKSFGVWLLLDRSTKLDCIGNKPDINQLKMLSLKNRLNAWKKEVRISGYTPIIRINYFNARER